MKKLRISLLLLSVIALAGCGTAKLSQSEIFDKKEECNKYLFILDKETKSEVKNQEKINKIYNDIFKSSGEYLVSSSTPEIFYSKKENTCFGTYTIKSIDYGSGINSTTYYYIKDLLTNKLIYRNSTGDIIEYMQTIKGLKGE